MLFGTPCRAAAAADTVADGEQYSQGQQQNVGKIHKHLYCGAGAMVRGANHETFFFSLYSRDMIKKNKLALRSARRR